MDDHYIYVFHNRAAKVLPAMANVDLIQVSYCKQRMADCFGAATFNV